MTNLFKMFLFISSYSPLYLIVALSILPYKNFDINSIIQDKVDLTVYIILIVLFILSFLPLVYINKCECNDDIVSKRVSRKNEETLSYLVTYIVPLLAIKMEEISTLITNAILFTLIGFLYVKSNMLHINITFLLFGWNIYEDELGRIIISKENPDYFIRMERGNKELAVKQLGINIYLHRK
ncbi:hypothetical protein LZ480_12500 [Solibacillus sp. MA9]|uniref:Uncharacterized protein n=1 Tax=Solibacillus palustris TaxID=2908203 RepID=A0ABS9UEF3_9BACL|nr:hypothetical protein [Solibacillus sp. MA9]MCH7322711.1 hypothetical protein [Solibacillus sp. MA9]